MSKLIVAATPLGNYRDASVRLKELLETVKYIVVEDSRKFHRLCSDLGIEPKANLLTFFEGNERERISELEKALSEYPEVLLITDAGMPGISVKKKHQVEKIRDEIKFYKDFNLHICI